MTSARPSCWILVLGIATCLVATGVPDAAEKPAPNDQETAAPADEQWRLAPEDSERAESIRRAREEIRKDPEQKKFILFRYGIREEDLR
jgi:hypothetical protein